MNNMAALNKIKIPINYQKEDEESSSNPENEIN
jgi:hypothetical protein